MCWSYMVLTNAHMKHWIHYEEGYENSDILSRVTPVYGTITIYCYSLNNKGFMHAKMNKPYIFIYNVFNFQEEAKWAEKKTWGCRYLMEGLLWCHQVWNYWCKRSWIILLFFYCTTDEELHVGSCTFGCFCGDALLYDNYYDKQKQLLMKSLHFYDWKCRQYRQNIISKRKK